MDLGHCNMTNHPVTCKGNYGCIMDILGCFWALIEALVAQDVRFRLP